MRQRTSTGSRRVMSRGCHGLPATSMGGMQSWTSSTGYCLSPCGHYMHYLALQSVVWHGARSIWLGSREASWNGTARETMPQVQGHLLRCCLVILLLHMHVPDVVCTSLRRWAALQISRTPSGRSPGSCRIPAEPATKVPCTDSPLPLRVSQRPHIDSERAGGGRGSCRHASSSVSRQLVCRQPCSTRFACCVREPTVILLPRLQAPTSQCCRRAPSSTTRCACSSVPLHTAHWMHSTHIHDTGSSSACLAPLTAAWLQPSADRQVLPPLGVPRVPHDPKGEQRHRVTTPRGTLGVTA